MHDKIRKSIQDRTGKISANLDRIKVEKTKPAKRLYRSTEKKLRMIDRQIGKLLRTLEKF